MMSFRDVIQTLIQGRTGKEIALDVLSKEIFTFSSQCPKETSDCTHILMFAANRIYLTIWINFMQYPMFRCTYLILFDSVVYLQPLCKKEFA